MSWQKMSRTHLMAVLKEADADKSGDIDFDEFMVVLRKGALQSSEDEDLKVNS